VPRPGIFSETVPVFSQHRQITSERSDRGKGLSRDGFWSGSTHLEALANLAHELRTPVQVLLGYIDTLRDEPACVSSCQPREIIERMNSNAHDLAQTVENVLEFAMAAAGAEAHLEENIELEELLGEILPLLQAANQKKHLEIRIELAGAPAVIRSRRHPIEAILRNLAANAVKFTPSGRVTLAIRETRIDNSDAIEIEVRDTGPGMSRELVNSAFEPLVQLSGSSIRQHRGLGLGLAIVKRNVKAMGGKLDFSTERGSGSCFKIVLPCAIVQCKRKR
jgi:signal transduction histidine kinase